MIGQKPLISVITPCMNEEEGIVDCYRAVRSVFEDELTDYTYEHIFCDNASTDSTAEVLRALASKDSRVKLIVNARNFGTLRSNFHGLRSARGDAVLVALAADLQDPPELIPQFVAKWRDGYEIVYGIRSRREEGLVMRTTRRAYYRLVSLAAEFPIPVDVGEFQLIDRRVADALRGFDDNDPYVRGLIASCGFRSTGIPFTWRKRTKGNSKARFFAVVGIALNGLISVSRAPMRICLATGLVVTALSVLGAGLAVAFDLVSAGRPSPLGIPALIASISFLAGVQLTFTGILGEYIAAIHRQTRKSPLVIERERINFDVHEAAPTAERMHHFDRAGRPTAEPRESLV